MTIGTSRETSNDYDDQDILGGLEDHHAIENGHRNGHHDHGNLISLDSLDINHGMMLRYCTVMEKIKASLVDKHYVDRVL